MAEPDRSELRPTERFSDRVEDYVRTRPDYPDVAVDWVLAETGLGPGATVVDLGSGTGLLARSFLARGLAVVGVEPNRAMRVAGERELAPYDAFRSVDGRAEATGLPEASVDLATAGQAFHWFEPEPTRRELARILSPGGQVALVWNLRRRDSSPFLAGYEALLERWAGDYDTVHRLYASEEALRALFGEPGWREATFEHEQRFDWEGLRGRLLSSSYTPPEGDPARSPMLKALRELFDRHRLDGVVRFEYDTTVYLGRPARG
ncbi:MAG: class I SAM-dependent methyltransferase [Candidatus Palauibacterales bacterium]|nr:class I SAM-dependent methyltransferase [Candidatus Palauibacterales bacterium]